MARSFLVHLILFDSSLSQKKTDFLNLLFLNLAALLNEENCKNFPLAHRPCWNERNYDNSLNSVKFVHFTHLDKRKCLARYILAHPISVHKKYDFPLTHTFLSLTALAETKTAKKISIRLCWNDNPSILWNVHLITLWPFCTLVKKMPHPLSLFPH